VDRLATGFLLDRVQGRTLARPRAVEARSRDLVAAAKLKDVIEDWPQADYRWRIRLKAEADLTRVFAALQQSINYGNFKSRIAATPDQRAKLHAYHELWGSLCDLQRGGAAPQP
jgi:hypothetical protein